MAYTSGTAANYKDLLAIMTTFAASNGWVVLEQSASRVYLKGTGTNGLDEIYCGVDTYEDPPNSIFNWELFGAIAWRAGRAPEAQPMSTGNDSTFVYLWDNAIPYWLCVSPRRIVCVMQVGTVFEICHLGFGIPIGTESQYPYPNVIGGCGPYKTSSYTRTDGYHRMFMSRDMPNISERFGSIFAPGGFWLPVRMSGSDYDSSYPEWASQNYRGVILTSPDGFYMLDEIYFTQVVYRYSTFHILKLDGIYAITGYQNPAGSIITIEGVNYLVFPDVYLGGYGHYFAMRLN